jgi:2-(1,2-epoxy-1,2-dihydrophenyl)acetyl-CoA isomerase
MVDAIDEKVGKAGESRMGYEFLEVQIENGVGIIRLNRPENRNAMVPGLRTEFLQALSRLEQDDQARALILTGEGKAFCAGGDLSSMKNGDASTGRQKVKLTQEMIQAILQLQKPVIAAVNGAAAGAGFSLALACDMVVAARSSFFVQSFVHVGLVPDLGSAYFLTDLLGHHRAKELMLFGERISAEQGHQLGFVNRVVDDEVLLDEARVIAEQIAKGPALAISLMKNLVNQTLMRGLQDSLELEAFAQGLCFQSDDAKEGVRAFFERRPPQFSGR